MRNGFVFCLAMAFAVFGCSASDRPISEEETRTIAAAVDSAMHAYLQAVAAKDADLVVAHYANDPDFLAYFDGTPYDYAGMSSTVRTMFGGLSAIDLEPVTVHVTVLGRDAAIAAFTFRESFTDTAQKVTPIRGTASWTWRRRGDGWSIIHGDAVHLPDTVRTP